VPVPLTVPALSAVPFSASAASAAEYGTEMALVLQNSCCKIQKTFLFSTFIALKVKLITLVS